MNAYKEHSEEDEAAAEALKKVAEADDVTEKKPKAKKKKSVTAGTTEDETSAPGSRSQGGVGRTFVQIMNGEILTRDLILNNLPFTFFIGFLFVVMIAWGYYGETVAKKEIQLEKELGELNSEFFTLTADYNMQRGRRQVAARLEPVGLKESVVSPNKIRVRKYIFN